MNIRNTDRNELTLKERFDEHLNICQEKMRLPRKKICILYGTIVSMIFIGIFEAHLSFMISIYFPIIWSIKQVDQPDIDGSKQWLTYWSIFALFIIVDIISNWIIIIVPFYFFIKTVFMMWLYLPNFKGATIIYNTFFRKFVTKRGIKISGESLMEEVVQLVKQRDPHFIYEQKDENIYSWAKHSVNNLLDKLGTKEKKE